MSELSKISKQSKHRWELLLTVSAAALSSAILNPTTALAGSYLANDDHPPIWIEIGGQLDQLEGSQENQRFSFETATDNLANTALPDLRKRPRMDLGLNASLSFEPGDSPWAFTASVRYGRTQRTGHVHATRTPTATVYTTFAPLEATNRVVESYTIADFKVGRDVGLGSMSRSGHSSIEFGLRMAQFDSDSRTFVTFSAKRTPFEEFRYNGIAEFKRTTSAFGPSLGWNSSIPLGDNLDDGLSLDWTASAALLFGRQKAHGRLKTHYARYPDTTGFRTVNIDHPITRAASKIMPNVGGAVSLSFHLPAAKLSVGYRADLFFDALDGGLESHKSDNQGFYGPFATLSIGFGG